MLRVDSKTISGKEASEPQTRPQKNQNGKQEAQKAKMLLFPFSSIFIIYWGFGKYW